MLSGHSSHTAGAPGAIASSSVVTAGSVLVFDLDQLGGVLGLVERLGHHERHRLADVAHALAREQRLRRDEHRRAVAALARMPAAAAGRAPAAPDRCRSAPAARRAPPWRALRVDRDGCAHARAASAAHRRAPARRASRRRRSGRRPAPDTGLPPAGPAGQFRIHPFCLTSHCSRATTDAGSVDGGMYPRFGRIYRAMPSQVKGYPGRLNVAARIMVRHAR